MTGRDKVKLDKGWGKTLRKTSKWNGPVAYILIAGVIDGGQFFYWKDGELIRSWACHDGQCFLTQGSRLQEEPDFDPVQDPTAAAHMIASGFGFPPDDEAYPDDPFELFDPLSLWA